MRAAGGSKPRILLVEDDADTSIAFAEAMSPAYDVTPVVFAEDAQILMQRTRFAVALVDIGLPGMSGKALIEWMASDERLQRVPVVIVSSGEALLPGNAVAFLRKPIVLGELMPILERLTQAA